MKKLWIQYLMVILSLAVMMTIVPTFSQSIKSAEPQPDWQVSQESGEENEYGDLVFPIPDEGISSDDAVTASMNSMSSMLSSILTSSRSSAKSSKPSVSSVVSYSLPDSTAPIPSSKPSSSSSSSSPDQGETVWVVIGGKEQQRSIREILPQIVENEIGSGSEPEALKAQAVAAHTIIRYYNDVKNQALAVSVKPVYSANLAKMNAALSPVMNQIMTIDGKPVYTPYSAASAGRTNSSAEVWGGVLSHLVSVESKYDSQDTKNWGTVKKISVSDVQKLLETKGNLTVTGSPETWFRVINRTAGGYNKDMSVCGQTKCTVTLNNKPTVANLTGRVLRENILSLKSAKFDVKVQGDQFIFTTYGYGHGAGMPQIGANLYAKNEKWSYQKILKHYYTGVSITALK